MLSPKDFFFIRAARTTRRAGESASVQSGSTDGSWLARVACSGEIESVERVARVKGVNARRRNSVRGRRATIRTPRRHEVAFRLGGIAFSFDDDDATARDTAVVDAAAGGGRRAADGGERGRLRNATVR